ncbi:MAG: hypothetical protein ACK5XH_06815 [Lysobacteraceae bacterium]|jgi:hypothetical protein|nr:hypothetical protein [Xanthomonadaceae bacterium]MCZ8319441.1 hypothetical protein [Silanimonas sp.]
MSGPRPDDASPPDPGGDGVRITALPPRRRGGARRLGAAIGLLVLLGGITFGTLLRPAPEPHVTTITTAPSSPEATSTPVAREATTTPGLRWVPAVASDARPQPTPPVGADPNDLASYFRPGDPVPGGAAVIKALQQSGIRTGLGAFNPPGTMPLLAGLAVPPDFPLPEGYVRHHQVTDDGEPIEPILMFAPGAMLRDATGRMAPLPADRIVTPELAPPGLPLRWVRPGDP